MLFRGKEVLQRDQAGLINKQTSQHLNQPQRVQEYHYYLDNQLKKWVCSGDTLIYDYDNVGNINNVWGSDDVHYRR